MMRWGSQTARKIEGGRIFDAALDAILARFRDGVPTNRGSFDQNANNHADNSGGYVGISNKQVRIEAELRLGRVTSQDEAWAYFVAWAVLNRKASLDTMLRFLV